MYIIDNNLFIKNFYYNRESVKMLIYLYNRLCEKPFLEDLISLVKKSEFIENEKKTNILLEIYERMTPDYIKYDLVFGYVYVFENYIEFYFKSEFDYDEFYNYYINMENDLRIQCKYLEVFDKRIKIYEIFFKNSFLRDFRNETSVLNDKKGFSSVTEKKINLKDKNLFSFLKKYEIENIKITLYFIKI